DTVGLHELRLARRLELGAARFEPVAHGQADLVDAPADDRTVRLRERPERALDLGERRLPAHDRRLGPAELLDRAGRVGEPAGPRELVVERAQRLVRIEAGHGWAERL